jgi:hypothetical protein
MRRMSTGQRGRLYLAAFLVASLGLLLTAGEAFAEVETPPSSGNPFSAQALANAILGGLQGVLTTTLETLWDRSGLVVAAQVVSFLLGGIVLWVWQTLGPVLGAVNFFTRLPPQWTTELAPMLAIRARLMPLAGAIALLGLVGGLVWGVICLHRGRPLTRLFSAVPTFLLATGGLVLAPQLMDWWVRFCNATSDALLTPGSGLPGLERMELMASISALGVVAVVYLLFGLFFLLLRLKLLVLVLLLLATAPLGIAAGALPFPQAQKFFFWWLTTFVAVTFVQVLQAVCLGIGSALLAAPVTPGGDAVQDVMSCCIGIGAILAAATVPGLLLGSLARTGVGGPSLQTVLTVASVIAGVGATAAVASRWSRIAPPMGLPSGGTPGVATVYPAWPATPSGYVRSILAGAPSVPALPPPSR